MANIQKGDTRTFDEIGGTWEVKDIVRDKEIKVLLSLNEGLICEHCKKPVTRPRNYRFKYVEQLENQETKEEVFMGISTSGRYVLLDQFVSKKDIKDKLGVKDNG